MDDKTPLIQKHHHDDHDYSGHAKYVLLYNMATNATLYGFQSILSTYWNNNLGYSSNFASFITNIAIFAIYTFALVGGYVSDSHLGLFKTLSLGSVIGIVGIGLFLVSSLLDYFGIHGQIVWMSYLALSFFVVGNGMIKPTTSALNGDQFRDDQEELRSQYFSWYYFSVQIGSIFPSIGIPILLQAEKSWVSFAVLTGVIAIGFPLFLIPSKGLNKKEPKGSVMKMVFSVIRDALCPSKKKEKLNSSINITHNGKTSWLDKAKLYHSEEDVENVKQALAVLKVFIPLPFFFAIFFQIYSLWVFEASSMDRHVFGFEIPAGTTVSLNPIMDLMIIPLTAKAIYPALKGTRFELTDLRKMLLGHIFTIAACIVSGFVELKLRHDRISIFWIIPQYFLISCAEILLCTTAYEFAYTQAPKNMKGLLTACMMFTIAIGNALVAALALIKIDIAIQDFAFAGVIFVIFIWFLFIARNYQKMADEMKMNVSYEQNNEN
eukprot:TRINITY_DN3975_c0_g1_i1.p1 TRINITY_DN3975_c0_g1~~TRINITY_DN3975_c0_g1_i1.p1  ORF type:complete len:492 (-),score=103.46 TRINITY_DN3975_c0_g1_i1:13-1488(-)